MRPWSRIVKGMRIAMGVRVATGRAAIRAAMVQNRAVSETLATPTICSTTRTAMLVSNAAYIRLYSGFSEPRLRKNVTPPPTNRTATRAE